MNLKLGYLTQVVGCTKNMIRTVKKMKAEGKSLEPNFKGGAKRIGRESVRERFSSLQASDSNHHIDSNHINSLIYLPNIILRLRQLRMRPRSRPSLRSFSR